MRRLWMLTLAVLLVAACGVDQEAQTGQEVPAIQGVDAQAGPIQLLDLLVPYRSGGYPAGSDVPLMVRLFSTAEHTVNLQAVGPGPAGTMAVQPAEVVLKPAAAGSGPEKLPIAIAAQECRLLLPLAGGYLDE